MESVEPKKNAWAEVAVVAAATAVLVYYVPLAKILAGAGAAVGLGFVIFWHELGHFLAAKWAGVKVLRFSIGFGLPGVPPIVSYRKGMGLSLLRSRNKEYEALVRAAEDGRPAPGLDKIGETEYVLGVLPLGGYVGMLGEDPGEGEERPSDPRAFINKPVGVRMVILSAGVAMNILLGLACFTIVYLRGTLLVPPRIGLVGAGSAAYMAGLKPGDEVVSIDGRRDIDFEDISNASMFSREGQVVRYEVKRSGVAEPIRFDLTPHRRPGESAPRIGVAPSTELTLGSIPIEEPAGMVGRPSGTFEGGDTVAAIGPEGESPTPVSTPEEVDAILAKHADRPLVFVVKRVPPAQKDTSPTAPPPAPIEARVTVPPVRMIGLGLRMAIEPIAAVRPGSIADKAGFRAGDRIKTVDGRDDFDPLRLPTYCFEHSGREVRFEVVRKEGNADHILSLAATPDDTTPRPPGPIAREPIDLAGLGLAYSVSPRIVAVEPGSPAAKAGLRPGETVSSMTITEVGAGDPKEKPRDASIKFDPAFPQWQIAFGELQAHPKSKVTLSLAGGKDVPSMTPEPIPGWSSGNRGLNFLTLTRRLPPQGLGASLSRGSHETWEKVLQIYAMLRGLVTRRLPADGFTGFIGIGGIAYSAAMIGLDALIPFLGLLSINLAVLNFLPIPPLDGGQILFLIFEKVRGRPLPEGAENFVKLAGVGLVLILFVVVTFNDIMRYFVR